MSPQITYEKPVIYEKICINKFFRPILLSYVSGLFFCYLFYIYFGLFYLDLLVFIRGSFGWSSVMQVCLIALLKHCLTTKQNIMKIKK